MFKPSSFFALVKHLQQIRIASQREILGKGWAKRYERLCERLDEVVEQCDQRDLLLVNGLEWDRFTGRYDIDPAYLQDYSLKFFDRYVSWIDDLEPQESENADEKGDESITRLKDSPLYQYLQKRR